MNLAIPADHLLFDEDLVDYYIRTEPYHDFDGLTPECMWVMNPDQNTADNCSILIYSEVVAPSSYALYDYYYILQNRMANTNYTIAPEVSTSYLSGKIYASVWMSDETQSDPVFRKYFYRLEGDRIFCIVVTSPYNRINILQKSLLELEN